MTSVVARTCVTARTESGAPLRKLRGNDQSQPHPALSRQATEPANLEPPIDPAPSVITRRVGDRIVEMDRLVSRRAIGLAWGEARTAAVISSSLSGVYDVAYEGFFFRRGHVICSM